ncbi:MAG: cyclic nucleotide-binding domain-containing protein [Deltaproteobacteria bacterium]|nr:cyclic nucleotide-binding domain-containing protein [Deltaproteobacteria bacterium]MBW2069855.1 cyclic nucleotide-binding domain-containing protein [Deltaproteobacteria bacterium]
MNSFKETESQTRAAADGEKSELEKDLQVLRNVPAFSVVPLETLRLYAYLSRRLCYRQGTFLFRQDEPDSRGYILVSGTAQLLREYPDRTVELQVLKEGDFFGGLALLADIRRLFSARALTTVECLTLDRESFRRLLKQFPEVGIKVLEVMVNRVVKMQARVLEECSKYSEYGNMSVD